MDEYHSAIFFEHVAEHATGTDYLSHVRQHTADKLLDDLGKQTHILATGLQRKSACLRIAVAAIILVELPSLLAVLVIKLITIIHS